MLSLHEFNVLASKNIGGLSDYESYHIGGGDTRNTKAKSRSAAPGASNKGFHSAAQMYKYMKRRDEKLEREEERKRQERERAYNAL